MQEQPRRAPLLDPKFRYRDSVSTDIRKTFARIKREQQAQQQAAQQKREQE